MKKLLSLLVALIMSVCVFSACEESKDVSKDKDNKKVEEKKDKKNSMFDEEEETTDDIEKEEKSDEEDKNDKSDKKDKEDKSDKNDKKDKEEKKNNNTNKKDESSEEKKVEAVVENFYAAVFTGDKSALNYVESDKQFYTQAQALIDMFASIKDEALLGDAGALSEEELKIVSPVLDFMISEVMSRFNVTVDSVEVNGDTAVATCTLYIPDLSSVPDPFENFEPSTLDDSTIKDMKNIIVKALDDATVTKEPGKHNLEKIGGEWKIVSAG